MKNHYIVIKIVIFKLLNKKVMANEKIKNGL